MTPRLGSIRFRCIDAVIAVRGLIFCVLMIYSLTALLPAETQAILGRDHAIGHWGLRGMRERAKLVGGNLEVWSQLDAGTEIELNIPAASAYAKSPNSRGTLLSWLRRSQS